MTDAQFLKGLRAFSRRKPFREFSVEFVNDQCVTVSHPDAIAAYGDLWLFRSPQGVSSLFTAESVCRLFDARASTSNTP